MKKYAIMILLFFMFLILLNSNKSYAIDSCINEKIILNSINNTNIKDYIEKNNEVKYISICSFNDCYNLNSNNLEKEIRGFIKYLENNKSEEYLIEAKIKGYPITEIIVNRCV